MWHLEGERVEWRTSTIAFQGTNSVVSTNRADIYLIGANSLIQGRNVANTPLSLDSTLQFNFGALRLQQGRSFVATGASGNFENGVSGNFVGLLELTGSTFQSNNLLNNGAVSSFGTSALTTGVGNRVTGSGSITANSGTLTVTRGVNMIAGSSLTTSSGATVDLLPGGRVLFDGVSGAGTSGITPWTDTVRWVPQGATAAALS